jgi:acyl-CoA synthetase (NDP forming)
MATAFYDSLRPLFRPRSVAILGASEEPGRIGGRPLQYLKDFGFQGNIYPVNPNRETVQGLPAYKSIKDIKGDVDQAIMAVPAKFAVEVAEECAAKGVKSIVAFTSGFAEMSEEGVAMQRRLTEIARESGMRILGPNCLGIFSCRESSWSTFSSSIEMGRPKGGGVGIASQSGAFGAHIFSLARERGVGFSYWATTGNECDVEFADCVRFLAEDDGTNVILGYMEGCRDVEKLYDAFAFAHSQKKPIVMQKVGNSDIGAHAAASHTASLAGADDVYEAVFKHFNVYRARTARELVDIGYACSFGQYPKGNRLGIVTISGGAGVLMADAAAEVDLDVAPMPAKTQKKLKELIPFAGTRNPVDTTANFYNDWSLLTKNFDAMLSEGNYDSIASFFTSFAYSDKLTQNTIEAIRPIREKFPDRPMALSVFGKPENLRKFEDDGILAFEDPAETIYALAALNRLRAGFDKPLPKAPAIPKTTPKMPAKMLNEYEAKRLMKKAGIPSGRESLVTNAADAAKAAARIGFPVVMKIVSPDILHKTEIGGVKLNLDSQAAVRKAYTEIMANAKKREPNARIDGVLIAKMVKGEVETILGTFTDPTFGPVVMFGLGGIFAEILKDVTFRVAPFGVREATQMIKEIKGYGMLLGARGKPPADIPALAKALSALSIFAVANKDTLESVDINPFLVMEKGKGGVALDALLVPRKS